jgi:hypothetical protein
VSAFGRLSLVYSLSAGPVYTASWTAPTKAGVHSEQFFHYMGSKGEINVNQARRGYEVTIDGEGRTAFNPYVARRTFLIFSRSDRSRADST